MSVCNVSRLKCFLRCVFFAALAGCSEAYFSALAKMGDQALHTLSSHSLGETVVSFKFVLNEFPYVNLIHHVYPHEDALR